MLSLEALQQRGNSQSIKQSVEEAGMDERVGIKAVHFSQSACIKCALNLGSNILVPRPISSGIKAPHCTTLHIVCNSSTQKIRMISNTSRVNSGKRTR